MLSRFRLFWLNLPIRSKGIAVVTVPLLCLAATVLYLGYEHREDESEHRADLHYQQVRVEAQRVFGTLIDAETGIRGYDVTGDPAFLEPYHRARERLPKLLTHLQALVREDRDLNQHARRVEQLAATRMTLLEKNRRTVERSDNPMRTYFLLRPLLVEGKAAMDEFREAMDRLLMVGEQRIQSRLDASRQREARAALVVWGAAGLGVAGGLLAMMLFSSGVTQRLDGVRENADRLARGESPLRAPEGADEIGHLERQLRLAATILREREEGLHESQRSLAEARDAALAANRAKSEFLATMSHEIRTPMNAIVGVADLLWDTPLSEEQREYVGISRRAGGTLLAIINDVLDLAKIEAGQLELEETLFDVRSVVEETTELYAVRAHAKGLELTAHIAQSVATRCIGDPNRLRQVLGNLMSNAVKFTEQGEVVLRVEPAPGQGLRFSVRDTGIGIPAAQRATIFHAFTQADSSTTRQYGGTGLGLTICRRLVELMGGDIWVESTPNAGSTFSFTARLHPAGDAAADAPPAATLAGLHALVVDDNATNRLILREMLGAWGVAVTDADGAYTALEATRQNRFDLIFLDGHMPDVSGLQLAEILRREGACPGATVMMLTSDQRVGDGARARELGLNAYLVKPIKQDRLLDVVQHAMGSRPPVSDTPSALEHVTSESDQGLRILLAEDIHDNQALIRAFLKKTPHRLDIAENGKLAVDRFAAAPYDLVLMDMEMPVLDGYAATRAIREWERTAGRTPAPIIALTAHALDEHVAESLAAGCDAHLSKPVRKSVLLEQIERHAGRARA